MDLICNSLMEISFNNKLDKIINKPLVRILNSQQEFKEVHRDSRKIIINRVFHYSNSSHSLKEVLRDLHKI